MILSTMTIYREQDEGLLPAMIETLPKWSETCLIKTIPSGKGDYIIKNIKKKDNIVFAELHYKERWTGDFEFARARNKIREVASGDWLLHLDSDDRLLIDQHPLLSRTLESADKNIYALLFNMLNYINAIKGDKIINELNKHLEIKCIRNNSKIRWESQRHETVEFCLKRMNKIVLITPLMIHHIGYEVPIEKMIMKYKRNIEGFMHPEYSNCEQLKKEHYFNLLLRECIMYQKLMEVKNG